jgi:hypothetical protein
MMEPQRFGRHLLFAIAAAVGTPAAVVLLGPLLGTSEALRAYVAGLGIAYLLLISDTSRRRLQVGLGAAAVALLVLAVTDSVLGVALGGAVMIAVTRSALLFDSPGLRGLALETAISGGGLFFARYFFDAQSLVGIALALWIFFLIQSGYFIVGGVGARPSIASDQGDAFEAAREHLTHLLDKEA